MNNNENSKGISLIVLVITIIVIIILAGTVILSLSANNPITKATEASVKNNLQVIKERWNLAYSTALSNNLGVDPTDQQVSNLFGTVPTDYIIKASEIIYTGTDPNIIAYAANYGITVQTDFIQSEGVNKPKLATGMTAKKWDGSSWITVSNPDTDTSWYDYTNKEWANSQTADGSMWVWIPRYQYKITTPHTSVYQTIDVSFLSNLTTIPTTGYTVHPAFTFGTTELTGIWVAKFEASGTVNAVDSKPSATSLRSLTIASMFTACSNMETTNGSRYGWGTNAADIDTHLIKNTEWGAVAYLSSSAYGKSGEVWINPNTNYITGQAGTDYNVSGTTTTSSYSSTNGVKTSTTGNIYGVYDMSGGAYEYVAAYISNSNSNLTGNGASLVGASSKYKDVYTVSSDTQSSNYSSSSAKKGDAIYETSTSGTGATSWYSDYSSMPYTLSPFFLRGGYNSSINSAGLFSFDCFDGGSTYSAIGFRPALAVAAGI